MLRKRVSVSIPVFNEEKYIIATLQGFLNQDFPKDLFEIIVVDNNSTDKTKRLVKEFAERFPKLDIKLVNEKQQGQIFARKKGIDMGQKSTYLLSLDGESLVPQNFISQSIKTLQKRNVDGVAWRLKLPWDIFLKFSEEMRENISLFIRKKEAIQSFIESYFGRNLDGSAFGIRSSVYKKIGGMRLSGGPLRYDDDIILGRRIIYNGGKIVSSRGSVVVSGRRMLADTENYLSGRSHWGEEKLQFFRREKIKNKFLSKKDFNALWEERLKVSAEIFLRHMLDVMLYYQRHPESKTARKYILKSAELFQTSLKSCLSMIEGLKWEMAYDILKNEFQTEVERKIKLYVQKKLRN